MTLKQSALLGADRERSASYDSFRGISAMIADKKSIGTRISYKWAV
jgi:hypothetical protein